MNIENIRPSGESKKTILESTVDIGNSIISGELTFADTTIHDLEEYILSPADNDSSETIAKAESLLLSLPRAQYENCLNQVAIFRERGDKVSAQIWEEEAAKRAIVNPIVD